MVPRPATPLSVLLLIAFGLLLVSVLSTPIIKGIPLGSFQDVTFGVFGFCDGDTCSSISIGYDASSTASDAASFDLPSSTRDTLTTILIVHPIAAFMVLVYFIMAIAAHAHSAAHSSRYLLFLFIFGLFSTLVCLLAFVVDLLLFVPHMAWGSYLVLAATILVAIGDFVSCMIRRSMVGRKARRNKVQENAEMNGQNFFPPTPRNPVLPSASETTMVQQPTVPVLSGGNGRDDNNLPKFATYESQKRDDISSDERVPLTSRSPSDRSPNNAPSDMTNNYDGQGQYGPPSRSNTGGLPPRSRDAYGNPMGQNDAYAMRRGPSTDRMNGGRGGMPPPGYRGRGGYGPPPGRGGYGPTGYGPPPGRSAYGSRGRGGYGPRGGPYGPRGGGYGPRGGYGPNGMMRGGRGPPPPGPGQYQGPYDRTPSPSNAYGDPYQAQNRSPRPASPGRSYPNTTMSGSNPSYQAYTPSTGSDLPRAESPPPLPASATGQAVEMDATSSVDGRTANGQYNTIRDSDVDVVGMVALQQGNDSSQGQQGLQDQGRALEQGRTLSPPNLAQRHNTYNSESQYSTDDQYVPARQDWSDSPGNIGEALGSPPRRNPLGQDLAAAELPTSTSPPRSQGSDGAKPAPAESDYYEDVDPRFAEQTETANPNTVSMALTHPSLAPVPLNIPTSSSTPYEDLPAGARSPAESERSNFTSISQRGVNPRWNGGPPNPPIMPQQISRRPLPPRGPAGPDILNSNPDFQLPAGGTRRGGGTIPNSAYPTGI